MHYFQKPHWHIKQVAKPSLPRLQYGKHSWCIGIALVTSLAFISIYLSHIEFAKQVGLSSLTIGILVGITLGNTQFTRITAYTHIGVDYAKSTLLKAGIILFGFRITLDQLAGVGWQGLLTDITMLSATFFIAMQLGKRVFKLDIQTTILIGAGSSICGAAAIMATQPVIKAPAHKVSVAVATVVVFGTLSMFIYPLSYEYLGLSEHAYGIFVGSTIHEVAQVVAAGSAISPAAADTAVIEKMLRVMLLAPFLTLLSVWQYRNQKSNEVNPNKPKPCISKQLTNITIPWFAVLFIVACGVNSMEVLTPKSTGFILHIDNLLLTIAMVALGLRTNIGAIRQAGVKPLILGACLFLFLSCGGYLINTVLAYLPFN